jgi:hypothetical protein
VNGYASRMYSNAMTEKNVLQDIKWLEEVEGHMQWSLDRTCMHPMLC